MNANLLQMVIQHLEGRGRWIRAGHDDIVKYLSIRLMCGPNRLGELREVLISDNDVLHVEHANGKISRIGLAAWVNNSGIETEDALDLPSDLAAAHDYILRLEDDRRRLEQAAALSGDVRLAVNMAAECEAENLALRGRIDELTAERDRLQAQLDASEPADTEALRRQLASTQSALETVRKTVGEQAEQVRTLQSEKEELQRQLKELSEIAAFVNSDEGHELLHTAGAVMRFRRSFGPLFASR